MAEAAAAPRRRVKNLAQLRPLPQHPLRLRPLEPGVSEDNAASSSFVPLFRGGDRNADDAAALNGIAQKSGLSHIIDKLIHGLQGFRIPPGNNDRLLDTVKIVGQQTQTGRTSHQIRQALPICSERVEFSVEDQLNGGCRRFCQLD